MILIPFLQTCSIHQDIKNDPSSNLSNFSPSTKIQYSVAKKQNITVILYNIKGELLDTIASGEFSKGLFEVTPITSEMESGTYFLKLIAKDTTFVKKILVVK